MPPTRSGFFEIAGEIVFPDEAAVESWLERFLDPDAVPELRRVYGHLAEVSGIVASAFGAAVHLFQHGATVRIAAADLYEELSDPEGRATQAAACACLLAAGHGAEGTINFTGLDKSDSFVVDLAGGTYTMGKPDAHADRNEAYRRAMADLRRKYEDQAG